MRMRTDTGVQAPRCWRERPERKVKTRELAGGERRVELAELGEAAINARLATAPGNKNSCEAARIAAQEVAGRESSKLDLKSASTVGCVLLAVLVPLRYSRVDDDERRHRVRVLRRHTGMYVHRPFYIPRYAGGRPPASPLGWEKKKMAPYLSGRM